MKTFGEIERNYEIARKNLFLMSVFTLVNVVLYLVNANISFVFSATFPPFAVGLGQVFAEIFEMNVFNVLGIAVALFAVGAFLLCYVLSRRYKAFMLVAFILFLLDTLFLGFMTLTNLDLFEIGDIIDIGFHIWVLIYLGMGIKAWSDLRKFPNAPKSVQVSVEPMRYDDVQGDVESKTEQRAEIRIEKVDTQPLGEYDGEGETLATQSYSEMDIAVCRYEQIFILVINGIVYAENREEASCRELSAVINGEKIKAVVDSESIYLFVNGNMILQKKK